MENNEHENFNFLDDLDSYVHDYARQESEEAEISGRLNPEEAFEIEEEEERPEKATAVKKRRKPKFVMIIERVLVFILITSILCLVGGLGVEYVIVKGPSPTLSQQFVLTMLETRRFGFMAGIFLTEEELNEAQSAHYQVYEESTDASLINIPAAAEAENVEQTREGPQADAYGIVDEDGDGIVIQEIKRDGYTGYMMIVFDPSRVSIATTDVFGYGGQSLSKLCEKTNSIAGINAGGFDDSDGTGAAGTPLGLTVVNGTYYNTDADPAYFMGFDASGVLHVGWYSVGDVYNMGIVNGVTFGPTLVVNGEARSDAELVSGLNPRTAIGQRADGAVLMLVIDGRQVHSFGATYSDLAELMVEYGAVNASNLDGGSSSGMWFDGALINSSSAYNTDKNLPTAFVVSREG